MPALPPTPPAPSVHDERGSSVSVLVTVVMAALFLAAGLAVDGSAQVRAHRHAEVAAARAVRAGCDASAAHRIAGQDGAGPALQAGRAALAAEGVEGRVWLVDGQLHAQVDTNVQTTFLSLLGVERLSASGAASGELRRS